MDNVTMIHPKEMVELLAEGRARAALLIAREMRREGVRGALWLEFISAIAHRNTEGVEYARTLARACTVRDLYRESPVSLPVNFALAAELASWILHHEWTDDRSFNPARRLQQLLSLHESSQSDEPVVRALEVEALVRKGRLSSALAVLLEASDDAAADSFIRRAAVALFRAVPKSDVQDAMVYRQGQVSSFGLATISGTGHLFCEYSGVQIRKAQLFRTSVLALPEFRVFPDTGESAESLFSSCLRRSGCPRLTDRSGSLRDRRNAS